MEQDDWLPLVHALVQCDATRFRAATRVVQVLWVGAVSELEAMQLLTELNLGYALAIEDAGETDARTRTGRQVLRRKVLDEINLLLDATYRLVREAVAEKDVRAKVLSQLLGLVPSFFVMLAELDDDTATSLPSSDSGGNAIHEVRQLGCLVRCRNSLCRGVALNYSAHGLRYRPDRPLETRQAARAAVERADPPVPAGRVEGQLGFRHSCWLAATSGAVLLLKYLYGARAALISCSLTTDAMAMMAGKRSANGDDERAGARRGDEPDHARVYLCRHRHEQHAMD